MSCQAKKEIEQGKTDTKSPVVDGIARFSSGKHQKYQPQNKGEVNRTVKHLVEQTEARSVYMEKTEHDTEQAGYFCGDAPKVSEVGLGIVFFYNGLHLCGIHLPFLGPVTAGDLISDDYQHLQPWYFPRCW